MAQRSHHARPWLQRQRPTLTAAKTRPERDRGDRLGLRQWVARPRCHPPGKEIVAGCLAAAPRHNGSRPALLTLAHDARRQSPLARSSLPDGTNDRSTARRALSFCFGSPGAPTCAPHEPGSRRDGDAGSRHDGDGDQPSVVRPTRPSCRSRCTRPIPPATVDVPEPDRVVRLRHERPAVGAERQALDRVPVAVERAAQRLPAGHVGQSGCRRRRRRSTRARVPSG